MAKSSVKRNFDLKKLARKVPTLMSELLNARGGAIHDDIQNGIDLQKDIDGKSYRKMKRSTRLKRKAKGTGEKLLDETGNMRKTKITKANPGKLQYKIDYIEQTIFILDGVLRQINSRNYQIKNAIEWERFQSGM